MKQIASHIRKRFDRSVLPHLDVLYTVACQLTGSAGRAAGACRETVALAYQQFPAPADAAGCRTWLLKILFGILGEAHTQSSNGRVNTAADEMDQFCLTANPSGRNTEFGQGCPPHRQRSSVAREEGDALAHRVRQVFRSLPAEDRAVLMLVDVAELRYEEAARVLGVSIETVRCRVSHARMLLRCGLGPSVLRGSVQP
jgi:RNA polymerase sigma-70 factor, ECF subfamily